MELVCRPNFLIVQFNYNSEYSVPLSVRHTPVGSDSHTADQEPTEADLQDRLRPRWDRRNCFSPLTVSGNTRSATLLLQHRNLCSKLWEKKWSLYQHQPIATYLRPSSSGTDCQPEAFSSYSETLFCRRKVWLPKNSKLCSTLFPNYFFTLSKGRFTADRWMLKPLLI